MNGMVLSPKQMQQRQRRELALRKIDEQICGIMNRNKSRQSQFDQFVCEFKQKQQMYIQENQQLKNALSSLQNKYNHLDKIYLATKQQLQYSIEKIEKMQINKISLQKEIVKLKGMVKNQQKLFEDYRCNMQDELLLQKQLIKTQFEEQRVKLQKTMSNALYQMQKKYQQKIKKTINSQKIKDYKRQFGDLKKYIQTNKENMQSSLKKSESWATKATPSAYSTNDKHNNKGVFLL